MPKRLVVSGRNNMEPTPYSTPTENHNNSFRSAKLCWVVVLFLLAIIFAIFAFLPLMLSLLTLTIGNTLAFIAMAIRHQRNAAILALLTGCFMFASLVFTNWGFSMPNPRVRVFWYSLIPACIMQFLLATMPIWTELNKGGAEQGKKAGANNGN
jgi:hypothetical protein